VLGHPIPAYLCGYNQQSIIYVVVFYPRHTTGQAEIYYYTRMSLYRELLAKPKAAKVVADWFIQTNLLLYLLLAKDMAKAKGGSQEAL
jgi:hypothetical protein